MFRLYRDLKPGEFICAFGDTAQGGADANFMQFGSQTRSDVPLVMQMQGMATETIPFIRDALEYVYAQTKVKPVVCLEQNNGGSSAMVDLHKANVKGHYTIYFMRDEEGIKTDKMGWNTNASSRARMLGEYVPAFNAKLIKHYDPVVIEQHQTFIVNKNGKPEAAPNTHDDGVMSAAGMWQLMQTEHPPSKPITKPRTTGNVTAMWGASYQ